jgi:hypothetical protein
VANVHFIWWGPFATKAVVRPLQFAQLCPQHQVHFWCQDSATVLPAFYLALSGSTVKLRGCSSVRRIVGDAAYTADPSFARAQAVVDELDRFRANAAVKDLLTMIVLHAHGGYYFDTTVELAQDAADGSLLRRALAVTYPNVLPGLAAGEPRPPDRGELGGPPGARHHRDARGRVRGVDRGVLRRRAPGAEPARRVAQRPDPA